MSSTNRILLCLAMVVGFWSGSWAQKAEKAKVVSVIGEVNWQKKSVGKWRSLRVGASVQQADRLRTGVESYATLLLKSGSQLTVGENSVMEVSTLLRQGESEQTAVRVQTGSVLFNVKKLSSGRSTFEFHSSTATAAIRGTQGDFRVRGSRTLASLITGRLDLRSRQGQQSSIKAGQMALQSEKGFVVLPKPKDAKTFEGLVQRYLEDTTMVVDSLVSQIKQEIQVLDSLNQTESSSSSASSAQCRVDPPPAQVQKARLKIHGLAAPGTNVFSGPAQTIAGDDGSWSLDLVWDGSLYGTKTFGISYGQPGSHESCGSVSFDYQAAQIPLRLEVSTPSPFRVCGPVVLAGEYAGRGARLVARLGNERIDLSSADGKFQKIITISDEKRNWNESKIELVLTSDDGSLSKTIDLNVDRRCQEVNRVVPQLSVSYPQNTCYGLLSVSKILDDEVQVTVSADGAEQDHWKLTSDIRGKRFDLKAGVYSYKVEAVDLAGNRTEQVQKNVACYPDVRFEISVDGPAREVLRIPPPPPHRSTAVRKTVQFEIRNLPADDYRYLARVTVRMNGRVIKNWQGTQIRDTRYSVDVQLTRNQTNKIEIEVETQNGRIRKASKSYDFK